MHGSHFVSLALQRMLSPVSRKSDTHQSGGKKGAGLRSLSDGLIGADAGRIGRAALLVWRKRWGGVGVSGRGRDNTAVAQHQALFLARLPHSSGLGGLPLCSSHLTRVGGGRRREVQLQGGEGRMGEDIERIVK